MTSLNNISIRNKLVLLQVLTSLLVLGIFASVFIFTQIRAFKTRKANDVYGIAGVIAQNSLAPLQFQDVDAARKMLAELRTVTPDIRYSAILSPDHSVFAEVGRSDADQEALRLYRNRVGTFFTPNSLIVVRPVPDTGVAAGRVYLQVQLDELTRMENGMFKLAIALALATLLAAFIISYALQPFFSARLLALVSVMKRVGKTGEYTFTLDDKGTDEISTLIRVFSDLLFQIRENERRKDEFIGIASHELKTPLTNVKGYLELLKSIEDRQPNQQMVERAFINAKKLEKLVGDLLDVSKIQTGQLELNLSTFDLDELIRETIISTQMLAKDRTITFAAGSGATIKADRQRIEQVLLNLLSNAVKYSGEASPIQVSAMTVNKEIMVEVMDFGPGVPAEEEGAIFSRFYRAKGMSQHISGFGLGLYICRDIIHRHNGRIWVQNRKDGASFFFQLPVSDLPSNTGA